MMAFFLCLFFFKDFNRYTILSYQFFNIICHVTLTLFISLRFSRLQLRCKYHLENNSVHHYEHKAEH